MKTRVQSMVVPMTHARHGTPPQDDGTNGIVQHNLQLCVPLCGFVARQNQVWSDWGDKLNSKKHFSLSFLVFFTHKLVEFLSLSARDLEERVLGQCLGPSTTCFRSISELFGGSTNCC